MKLQFLTPALHGVLDCVAAAALIALPFLLGFQGEASRVFRRLLFVRRSHDERYKEQVFT